MAAGRLKSALGTLGNVEGVGWGDQGYDGLVQMFGDVGVDEFGVDNVESGTLSNSASLQVSEQ